VTNATFRGWGSEALDFFTALEADNSRTFWLAHKTIYDDAVKAPMVAFAALVADEFGPMRIFRPNRDVRFSKDKSLYKSNIAAATEGEGGEMFYLQVSAEGLLVASGMHQMARDQLTRFRHAIDDERLGPELELLLVDARARQLEIRGQALKVAPRGYPRDHPRVALLRHKGLVMARTFAPAAWLGTKGAATRITDVWRSAEPVNAWLATNVGPSTEPPDDAY
jgi:uncharacterized protein (TIGR02453 family)